ncbi:hypothetical protein [Stenotrophomonas sp. TWI587]|jgi:hypothetical protein|uniref:hypothetical protein n=1 Tax=Stenotrophomonas sp. TWI587 TaxID=3136783 RepID=UPI003207FE82
MITTYIYWISTALLSLLYVSSAFLYLSKASFVRNAQAELGFSAGFLVPFMVLIKLLAPVVILSRFNVALSDLAYAGTLYHLVLSGLAHLGVGKPKGAIPAALGLALLAASFATQNVAREMPSPYAPAAYANN